MSSGGSHAGERATEGQSDPRLGGPTLDPDQTALLRGKLYKSRKASKAEAGAKGGASKPQSEGCLEKTAEAVAKQTGVSRATVERDAKFAEAVETLGIGPRRNA